MNRKTLVVLVLTMVTLALTLPLASASGWEQFHGNVKHTGYSTSNAPDINHTAWRSDDIGAHSASSVTIADGRIFVYCWDYLVCLDEYTGAVLWNVSVENAKTNRTALCGSWVTPTYHKGKVFLSAARTYCFDATDGSNIWTFTAPTGVGAVDGSVAIAEGNVITSDWDGRHYYCLNKDDGIEIWNFTVDDDYAQSTPVISDGMVVFGSWTWGNGGHICCVNLTTGSEEWNITTTDHPCGSATINEEVAYMTTYDFSIIQTNKGELYALNITDGSVIWSEPVERTDSTPAVAYGNVYVCGGCKGFSDLMTYCFNATTGELLWNTSASDEIGNWKCSPAVADGKVFVGKPYFENSVMDYVGTYALDASTGEIVWSYQKGGSSPAVADDMVFTIGGERVYAFGSSIQDWARFHYDTANTGNSPADAPDTNHVKWITEDIGAVAGSQAMIVGDMVFVYANDEVYGISRETGATIWNASIPGDAKSWGSWASPAYNDGVLFVSAGYNLTRIDAETGTVLQQIAFPDGNVYSCNGGPTVVGGMVFVGSGLTPYADDVARSHYYAFDENDLTDEKWNITNGVYESATSTPAVAANRVVFGNGSSMTCADEANGNILWSTPLVGSVGGSAAIDVFNDRVYVTTYVWGGQGTLHALNFTNGVEDWNATINYTSSTPAIHGDHIYVSGGSGDEQGHTYCFDSTGVEQWNVSCGRWTMSPAIVDGKLFTGNTDPFTSDADGISAFNVTTGAPVWSYEHTGSSPSVADNLLVSIGNDGRVYAFSDILRGDANNDGSVTTTDAVIALQMAVGAVPPNDAADVNSDGAITSLDALMILQAVTGAITI